MVTKVHLHNEMDIVLATRRAKQLAELTGLSFADQAKFAAAVSEITRNALEHAGSGEAIFILDESSQPFKLKAVIEDQGSGIKELETILNIKTTAFKGKGIGISNSRKLVDYFDIKCTPGQGTQVSLGMQIPDKHIPINETVIKGWRQFFDQEPPFSPYEELKKQNHQLLTTLDQLKTKSLEVETQLMEIKQLHADLEKRTREVTRLSEERKERNRQLEKKNKELDEFAYIVAHDLKAPLNNINGLINYLKDNFKGSEDILNMLQVQATSMIELINGILSYARSGRDNIKKQEVNLKVLVQSIISSLSVPETMEVKVDENLPVIRAEQIYLQQIFSNLIGNAIKHHHQRDGKVWVDCNRLGDYCEFVIKDNGPGIPDKKKEKIFDMFSTIKQAQSLESTGIGLAIVKKIIETKGGQISVKDNEGGGAKFIFTWPYELAP